MESGGAGGPLPQILHETNETMIMTDPFVVSQHLDALQKQQQDVDFRLHISTPVQERHISNYDTRETRTAHRVADAMQKAYGGFRLG